ncbi:uncharacterized protein C18orf63-like [Battus philenor]|uniref:uncharacterized protein C18orf63-like n=1 Tax=Battus philenor TaxID=42288 RepID=UPI0035D05372
MQPNYIYHIQNPNFNNIGHIIVTASLNDEHDRSAPSDYHWKVLKCRMVIFSNSSILACPDKKEIKQIHVIINNISDDYDKLNSLFMKFSLIQQGDMREVSPEKYLMCFQYTMTARLAPTWNTLGYDYLINNRNFLSATGPQNGIKYNLSVCDTFTVMELKPVNIILIQPDDKCKPGESVRVLPSLNKAIIEKYFENLPKSGCFKCYKDLRRHWKNIHGYRLSEEEPTYYTVRFWRGEPLTYPRTCLTTNFPITTPMPKSAQGLLIARFLGDVRNKMSHFLGISFIITNDDYANENIVGDGLQDTQAVSLCTPAK